MAVWTAVRAIDWSLNYRGIARLMVHKQRNRKRPENEEKVWKRDVNASSPDLTTTRHTRRAGSGPLLSPRSSHISATSRCGSTALKSSRRKTSRSCRCDRHGNFSRPRTAHNRLDKHNVVRQGTWRAIYSGLAVKARQLDQRAHTCDWCVQHQWNQEEEAHRNRRRRRGRVHKHLQRTKKIKPRTHL
jgi:hypothetical protein